jgi:hypothetical protein
MWQFNLTVKIYFFIEFWIIKNKKNNLLVKSLWKKKKTNFYLKYFFI